MAENNDYIWAKPDPFLHFQIPPSTQGIRLEDCKIPRRRRKQGVILAAKGQALEKKNLQLVKPESGGGSDGVSGGGGGHGGGGIG
ncbi:hypothetical protein H5410_048160 [Solanum commersonii]|uniref:Uncharacterized protein n=1 Tax=Solanum commersonii TaxID=4109 RepID=A0A9J5XKV4_SOLCO|nr:hypothetical protein H5410_048160 [Solanum commersonii]